MKYLKAYIHTPRLVVVMKSPPTHIPVSDMRAATVAERVMVFNFSSVFVFVFVF